MRGLETVPVGELPGIPDLARGLMTGDPDVTELLPDRPTRDVIAERARRVLAERSARAPLQEGHAGIFTGQQAGLFLGPLLTLVKAAAAQNLAADITASGTPLQPVFWCAAEDHDLVEVTRVVLPGGEGTRDLGPPAEPLAGNRRPVGSLLIEADVDAMLKEATAGLSQPPDPEADALLRTVAGSSYLDAFTRLFSWAVKAGARSGLTGPAHEFPWIDAASRDLKPAAVPLAIRLVRERAEVRKLLEARAALIAGRGFPLQVKSDPDALPLFAIVDGERLLLKDVDGGLALKGREERFTEDEVAARFQSLEWLPSFSALSRPVAASYLYPVAATVLGPSEIAYWAQSYPLFSWAGVTPPVIVPRPMAAPVTRAVSRLLEKLGLTLGDVLRGPEAILRTRGAQRAGNAVGELERLRASVLSGLDALAPALGTVDAGLGKPLAATREKVDFALGKLVEKTAEAAGRADEAYAKQLQRLTLAVLPDGRPAERVFCALPYLLRYGRSLHAALRRDLRWDAPGLQVVDLDREESA